MKYEFSWKYEQSVMPKKMLHLAFDFDRDVRKLWRLNLPVEEISTQELAWNLDVPFFWQEDNPFSLKPRDVLNDPEKYTKWMERIMSTDVSYPIDIIFWKGRWQILDGLHRLCKQIVLGKKTIEIRKLPITWIDKIVP